MSDEEDYFFRLWVQSQLRYYCNGMALSAKKNIFRRSLYTLSTGDVGFTISCFLSSSPIAKNLKRAAHIISTIFHSQSELCLTRAFELLQYKHLNLSIRIFHLLIVIYVSIPAAVVVGTLFLERQLQYLPVQ
jgi:hypothetical protein